MKKFVVAASFLALTFGAFAQDNTTTTTSSEGFTSKNGHQVLPEAGDFSVAFNAIPVLNYVGNAFSNAGTNSISAAFPSTNAITLRKFIDANTAYRGLIRFDLGSTTRKYNTADDISADPNATVEDKWTRKNTNIILGAGLEKRKGSARVQGIYGAMATIGIYGSKNNYEYGNAFSASNIAPSTYDFNGNVLSFQSRVLSQKTSNGFSIGAVGFVGAEYFIAPKLSLGAEFQWGPSVNIGGKLKTETESWDNVNNGLVTTTTETAGGSTFGFSTVNTQINLNFFF